MGEKKENSEIVQIHRRQISLIFAGLVLLAAVIFAGGYFLGAYHAIEPFVVKIEQDSFADQVYASLSALYDGDGSKAEMVEAVEIQATKVDQSLPVINQETVVVPAIEQSADEPVKELDDQDAEHDDSNDDEQEDDERVKGAVDSFELVQPADDKISKRWYAQLIGYGLEKSAREFAQKLTKKGFDVTVTARTSRSAAGNQRTWYQVVTAAHENRDLLQKQVDKIVSLEKLKGVQISIC